MKVARLLVVLGMVFFCRSPVVAQDANAQPNPEARAEASAHFRRGVELFQEQAHRAALVEFQRAYEIAPDYRLQYNIGQTKLLLQDYLGAAQSYDAYLTGGGAAIPPDRRTQVEAALAAMQERVGRLSIAVNRDGAEVFVDDQRVGHSPLPHAMLVNVGRHRVSARAPDGATEAQFVDVAGGDLAEASLTLAMPVVAAAPVVSNTPVESTLSTKRKAAIATWSVGAALLIGGAVTGGLTIKSDKDLDALLDTPGVDQRQVSDERTSLDTLALTTDVLLGAGVAAVAVGTLLWLIDGGDASPDERSGEKQAVGSSRATLRWNVGLTSLGVQGRF